MTTVGGDVRQRGSEVSWFFYALGGEYDGQSDQYDSQSYMFDHRTVQRGGTTASDL